LLNNQSERKRKKMKHERKKQSQRNCHEKGEMPWGVKNACSPPAFLIVISVPQN